MTGITEKKNQSNFFIAPEKVNERENLFASDGRREQVLDTSVQMLCRGDHACEAGSTDLPIGATGLAGSPRLYPWSHLRKISTLKERMTRLGRDGRLSAPISLGLL